MIPTVFGDFRRPSRGNTLQTQPRANHALQPRVFHAARDNRVFLRYCFRITLRSCRAKSTLPAAVARRNPPTGDVLVWRSRLARDVPSYYLQRPAISRSTADSARPRSPASRRFDCRRATMLDQAAWRLNSAVVGSCPTCAGPYSSARAVSSAAVEESGVVSMSSSSGERRSGERRA